MILKIVLQFVEAQFSLRSPEEHSRHCNILEMEDLNETDRQHFSLVFGVNRRSLLCTSCYFDVTSGALLPDVMHDFLEGVVPLELKLVLKVCSICILIEICT